MANELARIFTPTHAFRIIIFVVVVFVVTLYARNPVLAQPSGGELILFTAAINAGARSITFTTEGDSFAPVLVLREPARVRWTFADGSTSDSPTPVKDYGTPGTRRNRLVVTPWSAVQRINIGYDAGDGGAGDIEAVPDQHVSKVEGLKVVAPSLGQWCSSYNAIESLDFSGFINLDTIECYLSQNLKQVNLANTPHLRRACFEDCDLVALDLSGSPLLEDLRGALNNYPTIDFSSKSTNVWHICVRDNPQITNRTLFADMALFPQISELFIWNDNQTGALRIPATSPDRAVTILADDNAYVRIDLRGSLQNAAGTAVAHFRRNNLSEINITGCSQLTELDVQDNTLDSSSLDTLLTELDNLGRNIDNTPEGVTLMVDMRGNADPSDTGFAHAENLSAKGWTVAATSWTLEPLLPDNGAQRIDFSTNGDSAAMRCDFRGRDTVAAWHWADGTDTPAESGQVATKTGLGSGPHDHYLSISNGAALLRFGAGGAGMGRLVSMTGFTKTPALRILYAYQESQLVSLDRTNATRLSEYHLKGTALSALALDQVFADAVTSQVTNGRIWCDSSGTEASETDRAMLLQRGWTLDMQ